MVNSVGKFYDRANRPPRGGWHFPIHGQTLQKHSESEIFEGLKRWRKNNGTYISDLDIEREIWSYYCNREPQRCSATAPSSSSRTSGSGPVTPREVTKEMQGPPLWLFLNTLAVQWTPALHDYFLHTIDAVISILVCPLCRAEWRDVVRNTHADQISSASEACHWVNDRHNEINERLGKAYYPYSRMVREFGAPQP